MRGGRWAAAAAACVALLLALGVIFGNKGIDAVAWSSHMVEDAQRPRGDAYVSAAQGRLSKRGCQVLDAYEGRDSVLRMTAEGTLTLTLHAPVTGVYGLQVGYHTLPCKGMDMEFSLTVDDKPYGAGDTVVTLNRVWRDDGAPRRTRAGNDLRPRQTEAFVWTQAMLADSNAANGQVSLSLTAGAHEITLAILREEVVIDFIALTAERTLPPYSDYITAHARADVPPDVFTLVQAENALCKSASAIYPTYDRTSSHTQPYHPTQMRLNTIGGSGWKQVGEWVEWVVEVEREGLYQLGMRKRQHEVKGYYVARQVMIDGAPPFEEMREVRFGYNAAWTFDYLSDANGQPYLFYLSQGRHVLRMQVTLGAMAPLIERMQGAVYALNELYRQIIMITGTKPDLYRDYDLAGIIPGLTDRLVALADSLEQYHDSMDSLLGARSTAGQTIQVLTRQLRGFAAQPHTIQKRMATFSTNISSFAEWILSVREQPLEIDYLCLASAGTKAVRAEDGVLDAIGREVSAFFGSFTQDYNTFEPDDAAARQRAITVWLSAGRDQAYVINRLIEEEFTAETGIAVELQLVSAALLKATIAGQGPDVNLFTGRGEVMNLAFRGALADMSALPGYDQTAAALRPGAQLPYAFEGGVYGMAEMQDFLMMFVRDDILDALRLPVPQTWEELMNIAPILQSNNLGIGLPYTQLGGAMVISNGVGMTNLFPSLLLQAGGAFYTDDHRATLLHEPAANAAFRMWTDFYTQYDYALYKDDFSRFRTGEMPVIIWSYYMNARLEATAPEIAGKWSMHLLPGTRRVPGEYDHATAADGTAAIILRDCEDIDASWQFVRWWTSADTQARYGRDIESDIGTLGRYTTANVEAFALSNWSAAEQRALNSQWAYVRELPEIPGGYYVSRNLDNAFRAVVLSGDDARESLFYWTRSTDEEILRKRSEMGLDK